MDKMILLQERQGRTKQPLVGVRVSAKVPPMLEVAPVPHEVASSVARGGLLVCVPTVWPTSTQPHVK